MIYADSDFLLALMKKSDWLQRSAKTLYRKHKGHLWTSEITLTELLLLARRYGIDPERLIVAVLEIAPLKSAVSDVFLLAARYMNEEDAHVFDALHAAYCTKEGCKIISSDKVFDRLGIPRVRLVE